MEKTFAARELTVREVRAWMDGLQRETDEVDLVGEMLIDDCSLADIARMSNYTRADLDHCTPSQVADFARQCKAANPSFFALRDRLLRAGGSALESLAGQPVPDPQPGPSSIN